jgi:hypothetical protein
MISINKLDIRAFAERAISERCKAFVFESGCAWFEFHEKFSSKDKYPEFELVEKSEEMMQGTFHMIQSESVADLWLVLTDFEERGVEFYTFWREVTYTVQGQEGRGTYYEWVVWTPYMEI